MSFAPVKKQKIADQVAEAIRQAIIDGAFGVGHSLPSERELAAQFECNRSSIREAMLRLEAWGLVSIRQGESTKVEDAFSVGGLRMLPFLLMPKGQIDVALLADVLSIRVMFLRWTAEQAALRAAGTDLGALMKTVAELEVAAEPSTAQRLDWSFFEQLVAMTTNRVLRICMNALEQVYLEHPEQMLVLYQALPFDVTRHQAAVAAIAAGDSKTAGAAMEAYGLAPLGGKYV